MHFLNVKSQKVTFGLQAASDFFSPESYVFV